MPFFLAANRAAFPFSDISVLRFPPMPSRTLPPGLFSVAHRWPQPLQVVISGDLAKLFFRQRNNSLAIGAA